MALPLTLQEIKDIVKKYTRVKVAGCDIDGISRGKVISTDKFLKSIEDGFGFCSVLFGWDMHDKVYETSVKVSSADNGFADVLAKIDMQSFRQIPWEDDMPFFLIDFYDNIKNTPIPMCPRSLLKRITEQLGAKGFKTACGIEYEFYNFKETPDSLASKQGVGLEPLTSGNFCYSLLRPTLNQKYFMDIFDMCEKFKVPIEGLHTETGPGVYEAAITYSDAVTLADRGHLFKTTVKQIGLKHGVISCFMAKPHAGLPGCSGHIHVSLADPTTGKNLFAIPQDKIDKNIPLNNISPLMKQFLAGVLLGLPSMMSIFAPNINSYKRLVENFWAPITVTYGFENRTAAVRIIAPPSCPPSATRLEMRVSGADVNAHLAVAAVFALGQYGIDNKLELPFGPLEGDAVKGQGERLARNLREAITKMLEPHSIARKVLGDEFVEHYANTREHECRQFDRAITPWELQRYMELV